MLKHSSYCPKFVPDPLNAPESRKMPDESKTKLI